MCSFVSHIDRVRAPLRGLVGEADGPVAVVLHVRVGKPAGRGVNHGLNLSAGRRQRDVAELDRREALLAATPRVGPAVVAVVRAPQLGPGPRSPVGAGAAAVGGLSPVVGGGPPTAVGAVTVVVEGPAVRAIARRTLAVSAAVGADAVAGYSPSVRAVAVAGVLSAAIRAVAVAAAARRLSAVGAVAVFSQRPPVGTVLDTTTRSLSAVGSQL